MSKLGSFMRNFLTPAMVLILAGVVVYDRLAPRDQTGPVAVIDGKVLGKKFAPLLAATYGDAWLAAADTMESGKSVAESQAILQTRWQEGRVKEFTTRVVPEFARVLGDGAEPTDPAHRAAIIRLWRDFAVGLKGGR